MEVKSMLSYKLAYNNTYISTQVLTLQIPQATVHSSEVADA
jgi:hypothetical protein